MYSSTSTFCIVWHWALRNPQWLGLILWKVLMWLSIPLNLLCCKSLHSVYVDFHSLLDSYWTHPLATPQLVTSQQLLQTKTLTAQHIALLQKQQAQQQRLQQQKQLLQQQQHLQQQTQSQQQGVQQQQQTQQQQTTQGQQQVTVTAAQLAGTTYEASHLIFFGI